MAGDITGARESNAGDEFHVLWATRKVLGLLDDSTGLRLVSMEDLYPRTLEGVHPAQLLGVDLTELYGGDTLTSASSIVVTQLKYSPRNPQTSWTAARLAQRRRARDPKTSVVGRLADVFRAISTQLGRDELVARLSLRLVSNQPAGPNIAAALAASARWLESHPGPANRAALLASLSARDRAEIERILDATGLPSRQATDFLRVFSLDVGQASRSAQDVQLTEALGAHVGADLEYHALALKDLVRARGLPEGEGEPIRRETVLAALHVPGMEALLPAEPRFERPDTVLPTPDPGRILAALDAAPDRRVLAHGGAGVGKTTSILELERLLPDGSVAITFDCFAAGGYLKQTEARHTPQRALLQLCNEIAMRCRVPMLVVRPHDDADLWRMFQARVDQAAAQLRSAGARLVIVIDAADNSVWAARRSRQASFVPDLWDLRVPEGAGLVVTARTGRLDQIAAPADVADVELRGFDETASAANLRVRFPHADADQALAFHERSRMNPRVQFYVLDASRPGSADTVEQTVEQAELTPEDIFDDLWSAAVDEALDPDAARQALANLLCLSKPTSLGRLAAVCGWPEDRTRRFASALYPGLRIEDGVLELRDEDFEKYLTEKFDGHEMRDAHGRLADLFAADPQDRYAATALAGHLSEAARTDDLIDLALRAGPPDGVTDPVARLGVYRERLRLAMRAATAAGRSADTAKLVVLAAGAAKSDRAMTKVVLERPGLALRHGDPEVVSIIWNDPSNVGWFGPIHMRLAAIRAADGDFAAAEEHLRHARAWLIRRQDEDKTAWDLRAADVAAGSEAVRLRSGWAAGINDVLRWRPLSFAAEVGEALMRTATDGQDGRDAADAVVAAPLPAQIKARLLAALGPHVHEEAVRAVTDALIARPTRRAHLDGEWPVAFCELAARVTRDRDLVDALTAALPVERPARAPSRWDPENTYSHFIRHEALRAQIEGRDLSIDELMPVTVTAPDSTARSSRDRVDTEKQETRQAFEPLLGIYALRARALLCDPDQATIRGELAAQLRTWTQAVDDRWYRPDRRFTRWAAAACDVALACSASLRPSLRAIADAGDVVLSADETRLLHAMAERVVADSRYGDLGLVWIDRAAARHQARPQQASELTGALLDLAALCERADPQLAGDLYARAIVAVDDLDDEQIARLEMHIAIAARVDADAVLAERVARAVEICGPKVSSDDMLPWQETAARIAELDAPTALALMTRWSDEGRVELQTAVRAVLPAALDGGLLTVDDGVALVDLLGDGMTAAAGAIDVLDAAARTGDGPATLRAFAGLAERARRDLQPDVRGAAVEDLLCWAAAHDLAQTEAAALLAPYARSDRALEEDFPYTVDEPDVDDGVGDPIELDELADRLHELWGRHRGAGLVAEALNDLVSDVAPARRVAVLDAITSLSAEHPVMRSGLDEVLRVLSRALADWEQTLAVAQWREQSLDAFLSRQLGNAVRYRDYRDELLPELTSLAGDRAPKIVVDGIAEAMTRFSPEGIYALAAVIGASLPAHERRDVLCWSLDFLDDGIPEPPTAPERTREECLAAVIWALFAHPDKQLRWRAAHAARAIIRADDPQLAGELAQRMTRRDGGRHAGVGLFFNWMSALVWAHMTFARIAGDAPETVAHLAATFADAATSTDWPHAAVREFARRSALRTAELADPPLAPDVADRLVLANRPSACSMTRSNHYGRTGLGDRGQGRLHFGIDTVPYWFGPLGVRFDLGPDDVARMAEDWIIDRLGMHPTRDSDEDDPRLAGVDYGERSNHQGSLPRMETPRVAIDYHALLLVAGTLADDRDRPVVVEAYEEPGDPWDSWLVSHLDADQAHWIVDVREPPPPGRGVIGVNPPADAWPEVLDGDFCRMLGEDPATEIVVSGAVHYSAAIGYGWDRVSSALVSPATAASLLAAITHAEDPSMLALPLVPPDPRYRDDEIDHGDFRLIGWLREDRRERDGLERHDRLARIGLSTTLPGPQFLDHHGAAVDPTGRRVVDRDGAEIARIRAFSDEPPPRRPDRERVPHAYGAETFVATRALIDFLAAADITLIIKLEATRNEWNDRDSTPAAHHESHRVLLIDRDGTVDGFGADR